MPGKALIFSAPSGSGKTTIVKRLLQQNNDLAFSISAATRSKRSSTEADGKDYHFLTAEDFKKKIDAGEFIEWEEVYPGKFYGTLKSEIERIWSAGKNAIFDVDVKGGLNIKKYFGPKALSIFVRVPSLTELENRLRQRATDSEESILKRLEKAREEMAFQNQFDFVLENNDIDTAVAKAQELYEQLVNQTH